MRLSDLFVDFFFFNQVEDNILKCECVELKGF